MNRSVFEIQADFCKVMGNSSRLQILHFLREGPLIVGDIVRETGLSQPHISRHLRILRSMGILKCYRQGNEIAYQLIDETIGEICDLVRKVMFTQMRDQARNL